MCHIQRVISNSAHFLALASVTTPVTLTAKQNWKQAVKSKGALFLLVCKADFLAQDGEC